MIVLGRDPQLLDFAEQHSWRQLALAHGKLRPLHDVDISAFDIDHAEHDATTDVEHDIPNLVRFPLSARTAGVA